MTPRVVYPGLHVSEDGHAQLQVPVPGGFEMVFSTMREEDEHAEIFCDAHYAVVWNSAGNSPHC